MRTRFARTAASAQRWEIGSIGLVSPLDGAASTIACSHLPLPPDYSKSASTSVTARTALDDRGLMAPYKNVIRLHLLIFFFAFAHFARLDNFLAYAVVSAVYFFPWRLLKREEAR